MIDSQSFNQRSDSLRPALGDSLLLARVCCIGAGAIHLAVIPSHLKEYWALPLFFAVAAVGQFAVGTYLTPSRATRTLLSVAAIGNLLIVIVWLLSRTVGLPLIPDFEVEEVGLPDVVASLQEMLVFVVCVGIAVREDSMYSVRHARPSEAGAIYLTIGVSATIGAIYVAILH